MQMFYISPETILQGHHRCTFGFASVIGLKKYKEARDAAGLFSSAVARSGYVRLNHSINIHTRHWSQKRNRRAQLQLLNTYL